MTMGIIEHYASIINSTGSRAYNRRNRDFAFRAENVRNCGMVFLLLASLPHPSALSFSSSIRPLSTTERSIFLIYGLATLQISEQMFRSQQILIETASLAIRLVRAVLVARGANPFEPISFESMPLNYNPPTPRIHWDQIEESFGKSPAPAA